MKSCSGDIRPRAARTIDRRNLSTRVAETRALRIASLDFDEVRGALAVHVAPRLQSRGVAAYGREETMQMHRTILAILCGTALFAIGCSSSTSPTTVSSLAVTGAAPVVGATAQFTATATMADGTTQDVTTQAAWTSSNATVATVSSTGLVTGVAAGSASVAAVYQSVSASDAIVLQ